MTPRLLPFTLAALFVFPPAAPVTAAEPAPAAAPAYTDPAPQHRRFVQRASRIDSGAREYPDIDYTSSDKAGKTADLQHATVDTRVAPRGRLVVWLMGHNEALFDRLAGYGLHAIQVHYANKWFGLIPGAARDDGTTLGRMRLEATTGEDASPLAAIAPPDGMAGRAYRFVRWLAQEHPGGRWEQYLAPDGNDLAWDRVIVSGSSHGATSAARFAVHRRVDRVVMFCGPRDQYETWPGFPSATPANRFFGFSHTLDTGWTGNHYCRSWQMLGLAAFGPVTDVDDVAPPYGNSRRLVTHFDVGGDTKRAHSSVTPGRAAAKDAAGQFRHEAVWRYLFTHPVEAVGPSVPPDPDCTVPPPAPARKTR